MVPSVAIVLVVGRHTPAHDLITRNIAGSLLHDVESTTGSPALGEGGGAQVSACLGGFLSIVASSNTLSHTAASPRGVLQMRGIRCGIIVGGFTSEILTISGAHLDVAVADLEALGSLSSLVHFQDVAQFVTDVSTVSEFLGANRLASLLGQADILHKGGRLVALLGIVISACVNGNDAHGDGNSFQHSKRGGATVTRKKIRQEVKLKDCC